MVTYEKYIYKVTTVSDKGLGTPNIKQFANTFLIVSGLREMANIERLAIERAKYLAPSDCDIHRITRLIYMGEGISD
jgi:hypothetical protein